MYIQLILCVLLSEQRTLSSTSSTDNVSSVRRNMTEVLKGIADVKLKKTTPQYPLACYLYSVVVAVVVYKNSMQILIFRTN